MAWGLTVEVFMLVFAAWLLGSELLWPFRVQFFGAVSSFEVLFGCLAGRTVASSLGVE